MRNRSVRIVLTCIFCISFVVGCATAKHDLSLPDSFAIYTREKKVYKAVTAGGVRVRSFQVKNEPEGSVEMWFSAIDIHLKSSGYQKVKHEDFTSPQKFEGKLAEYNYLFNGKDYTYLIAIIIDQNKIFVIESGGLKERVAQYKKSITGSMKKFTVENTH